MLNFGHIIRIEKGRISTFPQSLFLSGVPCVDNRPTGVDKVACMNRQNPVFNACMHARGEYG